MTVLGERFVGDGGETKSGERLFLSFGECGKRKEETCLKKLEKRKNKRGRMKREREGGAKVENLCAPRAAAAAHVVSTYVVGLSYYYL